MATPLLVCVRKNDKVGAFCDTIPRREQDQREIAKSPQAAPRHRDGRADVLRSTVQRLPADLHRDPKCCIDNNAQNRQYC
jgi:hypothetical protein